METVQRRDTPGQGRNQRAHSLSCNHTVDMKLIVIWSTNETLIMVSNDNTTTGEAQTRIAWCSKGTTGIACRQGGF